MVLTDLVQAHVWLSLAAERASNDTKPLAKQAIDGIEPLLTPEQLDQARRRASPNPWLKVPSSGD